MEHLSARLAVAHLDALVALFERISRDPLAAKFHPHPFTPEQALNVATYSGRDVYLGLVVDGALLGYGMLRGWDQGYDIPSLGIYIAPEARGRGLSRVLMKALHDCGRQAGARRIRLKVYPDNIAAVRLYERLGYRFESEQEAGQHVGYLKLEREAGRN